MMKNKLPCDIILDLLPSYVDGLTKDTTNEAVEEHVKECESCKRTLYSMRQPEMVQTNPEEEQEINFLRKTRKRQVWAILGTTVTVIFVAIFLFFVNAFFGNPISHILAEKAAKEYVEENYSQMDVYIDKVGYSFKFPSYYAIVRSNSSIDTHFTIYITMDGKVEYDTYESVLDGWNTYHRIDEEYRKKVAAILDNSLLPIDVNFAYGSLQMDEKETNDYRPVQYGIKVSELELDKEYDVLELGKTAGHIVCYAFSEELTIEKLAEYMMNVKEKLDEAGITFYAMDFVLQAPVGEEYDATVDERRELYVGHFLYEDIYEEGLTQRVQEAYEKLHAYYTEMDNIYKDY